MDVGANFWSLGPLKNQKRALEKIGKDYNGNARRTSAIKQTAARHRVDLVELAVFVVVAMQK